MSEDTVVFEILLWRIDICYYVSYVWVSHPSVQPYWFTLAVGDEEGNDGENEKEFMKGKYNTTKFQFFARFD